MITLKAGLIGIIIVVVVVIAAGAYVATLPAPTPTPTPTPSPTPTPTPTPKPLRPVLLSTGWLMSGWNAWGPVGDVKGFFNDEGISITIVRGYGGADTVGKVIAGTFEVGMVDFPTLIKAIAEDPDADIIALFIWMDVWGPAISAMKGKGIEEPKDLEGKTYTVMAPDIGRLFFPIFAEKVNIDKATVKEEVVSVALRVPMVIEGKADAVMGYWMSVRREFLAAGVDPGDVIHFKYSDYFKVFGEALAVRKSWLKENPEVAGGLVRAVSRSLVYAYEHPDEAINELLRREPLLERDVEAAYQKWIFEESGFTPTILEKGLSYYTDEDIKSLINLCVEAFGLPRTPSVDEVYNRAYLPPVAERKP